MDVIQTNYLNNILKEMKILSPFHNAARTAGIEWHGGKVNKYFMHISPILAVIAAFPVDKQTEIDVDTFDILNYRWISTCLSNGWAGKSFSGFTAAEVCDAIDALYGIRKYSNGEWPNFEYNKILTCASIINFARKTGKLQGEIDENNWQYIHDICIEGISRREAKIQEMNVNYRRHSVEALESALSVVDDESAKAEASSMVDKVDNLVKEEEERKQKEEEERLRKEEDRKKAEEEVQKQKECVAVFESKKKSIINNLKAEIYNLRTYCLHVSKVFNGKLNDNPEDLNAAAKELDLLVEKFILLNKRKSLLIEISKKSFGDSLDDFDSNNSNENKSAEDELSAKQSGCRIPDNAFSIRNGDSSWQITFSKCFTKRLADGGYRYASAYCVSGTYYIEFYKNFPVCACTQLNVSMSEDSNARISSKSLVLDIFKKLNISSSVDYARLQFSATDTPSQTIRIKVITPTNE